MPEQGSLAITSPELPAASPATERLGFKPNPPSCYTLIAKKKKKIIRVLDGGGCASERLSSRS